VKRLRPANAFFFTAITHRSRDVGGNPVVTSEFVRIWNQPALPYTSAPGGRGTCATCHGTLTAGSGVTVVNAPSSYTIGGTAVPMTVTIPATGGFELEVVTQLGVQAGVLAAGANGAVSTVGGIQFAYDTVQATSWTFSWTPPTTNVGSVVLYVTGGGHSPNYSNNFVMTAAAGNTAPSIASFVAGAATITAGNSTTLTAVFSGGTGTINGVAGNGDQRHGGNSDAVNYHDLYSDGNQYRDSTRHQTGDGDGDGKLAAAGPAITSFTASPAAITAGNSPC